VHGNADVACTTNNAARCLLAFGAPANVRIYPGAAKPLLASPKHAPEIHGTDGLGGVEGLPEADSPEVQALFAKKTDGSFIRALEGMATSIKETWNNGLGDQVTIVSTGPTTNIGAIMLQIY
jgi:uridine nucleosidase